MSTKQYLFTPDFSVRTKLENIKSICIPNVKHDKSIQIKKLFNFKSEPPGNEKNYSFLPYYFYSSENMYTEY
ncbi:hypothetical protein CMU19_13250 [Elizabethkingia anophelis]|nr:hypothetical protein [Elizabethkingia anophelis]